MKGKVVVRKAKNKRERCESDAKLLEALRQGDEAAAMEIMANTAAIQDRDTARSMLSYALNCSAELFEKLLDICPCGDYVLGKKDMPIEWTMILHDGTQKKVDANVKMAGTLVMIAAALNKPEHVRVLLSRGFDPDGKSLDSSLAIVRESVSRSGQYHYGDLFLEFKLRIRIKACHRGSCVKQFVVYESRDVTALAVALLFSNLECVRILLEHEKRKKVTDECVSSMLMLHGRENDTAYQTARQLILDEENFIAEEPVKLRLFAIMNICTLEQLEKELLRCNYNEQEIIDAILHCRIKDYSFDFEKLLCLEKYCPTAFKNKLACRKLIEAVLNTGDGFEREKFKKRCLALYLRYNNVIDVSNLRVDISRYSSIWEQKEESIPVIINRNDNNGIAAYDVAVYDFDHKGSASILPGDGMVLSKCAKILIGDNDWPEALRKQIESGFFDTEPILAALEYAKDSSFEIRAALLEFAAKNPRPHDPKKQSIDAYDQFIRLLSQNYEEEEERIILSHELNRQVVLMIKPNEETWQSDQKLALLSASGRTRAVEYLLEQDPHLRHVSFVLRRSDGLLVNGSPLCIAALFGQTTLMECLLTSCPDADELESGGRSFYSCGGEPISVTPLMAAIKGKQWNAAKILLDYGAKLDMGQWAVKEFLDEVGEEIRQEFLKRFGERIVQG